MKRAAPASFLNGHSQGIDLLAESGVRLRLADHFPRARDEPRVIENGLAHRDAVAAELPRFAQEPGGMGEGPDGNGSVGGRHSPELSASHQRRPCAEIRRAQSGGDSCRTGADDEDVHQVVSRRSRGIEAALRPGRKK